MSLNWNVIINCNSNPYSSIISSYLTYNIENKIKNIDDYKKHSNNVKIIRKINILFKKGRLQRTNYLKNILELFLIVLC